MSASKQVSPSVSSILFVCGLNSIRSPMAEVIARAQLENTAFIQSAGIQEGKRDPFVDATLNEVGLDLGDRQPRVYDPLHDNGFDIIVALSQTAHEKVLRGTKASAVEVLYWPIDDPTLVKGRRDQIIEAYRGVRSALEKKIKEQFSS